MLLLEKYNERDLVNRACIGAAAKKAMTNYLAKARDVMLFDLQSDILFVNCSGQPMSMDFLCNLIILLDALWHILL